MPIYTSTIKKEPGSFKAMEGATFNSTNFTQLEQSTGRLRDRNFAGTLTVDGASVSPFYYLEFFNYLPEASGAFYSALLINKGLQPGEEVTISGYFFKGSQPQTNNNNSIEGPITVVFENDSSNTTDFKTKPNSSSFDILAHGLPIADFIGQGIVPVSNGANVGTLNGGWKYNTTGRSDAAEIQARNADNTGDQTDATLHMSNLSSEGSFGSRFYTITIRNDSASEAFFKILSYDVTGTYNDNSEYFGVHDLRVEFTAATDIGIVEANSISGKENMDLSIRSDGNLKFEIDFDNNSTSKFKFIGGSKNEVASIDESGNLALPDVSIDGKAITMTGATGDTAVFTVGSNGDLSIVTTDGSGNAAANLQITAHGTVDINSNGDLTLDSGGDIKLEPAIGSKILLDGTISVDGGTVTGATSITSNSFVGALAGNANTASSLQSSVNIGGVAFDGSNGINLPGVNIEGNQNTTGASERVKVFNYTSNLDCPVTFITDTSPNGGIEYIRANAIFTANPSTGYIKSIAFEGKTTDTFKSSYGDLHTLNVNSSTTAVYVNVGGWAGEKPGFSVGGSGKSTESTFAGNVFMGPGYDLNTPFRDHLGNYYNSYGSSQLRLWVRCFSDPIDATPTGHTVTKGTGVSTGVDSTFDDPRGLPIAEWGAANTTARLTIADHADFDFSDSNSFSLSVWIYHPTNWTLTNSIFVAKGTTGGNNEEFEFYYRQDSSSPNDSGGTIYFKRRDRSLDQFQSRRMRFCKAGQANDISAAGWRHWVFTDGPIAGSTANSDMNCYINGVKMNTSTVFTGYQHNTYVATENLGGPIMIGGGQSYYSGIQHIGLVGYQMAEIAIWTAELSEEEVKAIYNASRFVGSTSTRSIFSVEEGLTIAQGVYNDTVNVVPNVAITGGGRLMRTTHSNSERILKTNIEELNVDLNSLCDLIPSLFNWKKNPTGKKVPGFIIDEVEDKFPELVQDAGTEEGYRSLQYDRFCAYIISAMKEIKERLEVLESKLSE